METGDDAGVYLLPDAATAVVTTADFITPPFDDPDGYGRIAAANALSDVYAMGGTPLCAINLCMLPPELHLDVAREILDGARALLHQDGVSLLGGHTVRGTELFYGLSVTGSVAADRIWRNVGAQPGDALLLTKPLGAGLIVTAARKKLVDEASQKACAATMATTNRRAAEILRRFDVHAATDVTGFGLVGHALGMTRAGDVSLQLELSALPVYAGARALAAAGLTCAGARKNREAYAARLSLSAPLSAADEELLYDPQTSGGLLVALPDFQASAAERALFESGIIAARIGVATPPNRDAPISIR
jgi:selenide,water dikinase